MSDTLKTSQNSGSSASESTPKKSAKQKSTIVAESGLLRLRSTTVGGENPGSGMYVPPEGTVFEADVDRGQALIACGLAELAAPEGAKGE
jgi:FKBP-type peptidyl-prolyl cis-trans isomerase